MKRTYYPTTPFVSRLLIMASFAIGATVGADGTTNAPTLLRAPAIAHSPSQTGKTGEWKDPEKAIAEVVFDNLPVVEIAQFLRDKFEEKFDVLLPYGAAESAAGWDWAATVVSLKVKNVKASEIFNAMNLVFETAKTPLHWDLVMNGQRPTALLRIVAELLPGAPVTIDPATGLPIVGQTPPPERPMVFFVGDLIGEPKSGGMDMDQVVATVSEVCRFGIGGSNLFSHKQAQLLIVRGTVEQIQFVQSTLAALRDKVRLDAQRQNQPKAIESTGKTNKTSNP